MSSALFESVKLGPYQLKNRIIMAPLTRSRAGDERVPNDLMLKYYVQRSTAGMILTEATAIHPKAVGYAKTPGIWSKEQIKGWKKITEAVQQAGSRIFLQLWHVGRVSHPMFLDGDTPVAPSAIPLEGHVSLVRPKTEFVLPRALETSEIKEIVQWYKQAAINAKEAGFDGVEIHGANGYLIDQFLQDGTNKRTDEYGGSIENRARFLMEITDACIEVWGPDRVGVHLAPKGQSHGMRDSDPINLFSYVAQELGKRKIAFIFTREPISDNSVSHAIRQNFGGVLIRNEKLELETANQLIQNKQADAIAFGMKYISNPDLVKRFKEGLALNETNFETIYAEGEIGYTDYPFSNQH